MKHVVLFGGTTEGRELAGYLLKMGTTADVYVVSGYGASLLPEADSLRIHVGRLDEDGMESMLREQKPDFVLDATHPYAAEVTRILSETCSMLHLPYVRVRREDAGSKAEDAASGEICVSVADTAEAVHFLEGTEGNIFLTTGSKELSEFSTMSHFAERCYVRALPSAEALALLEEAGVDGRHRILMQGPFSEELNTAMLRETDARWLVTKASGQRGGFYEKYAAAAKTGTGIVVIGCPEEKVADGTPILTLSETEEWIEKALAGRDVPDRVRDIYIVGMGPGSEDWVSPEARRIVFRADALAGARRMIELARSILPGDIDEQQAEMKQKLTLVSYKKEEMKEFVDKHPEAKTFAFLFSGDTRVYSGAAGLRELFPEEEHFQVTTLNGMSSVTYFAQKLRMSTHGYPEKAVIVSLHGREEDLIGAVKANRVVFVLLGGRESLAHAAKELFALEQLCLTERAGGQGIRVALGERLTYPDERIVEGHPADFMDCSVSSLSMLCVRNEYAPDGE